MADIDIARAISNGPLADGQYLETMVAIALAESDGALDALGDYIGEPDVQLPADADQHCAQMEGSAGLQCYTSIGPWQINQAWNWPAVSQISGLTDPNQTALWLEDYDHNATLAYYVYHQAGYHAWTTYNTGEYQNFLPRAQQALVALAQLQAAPPGPSGLGPSPSGGLTGPGLGASAGSGTGVPYDWSPSVSAAGGYVANIANNVSGYGQAIKSLVG